MTLRIISKVTHTPILRRMTTNIGGLRIGELVLVPTVEMIEKRIRAIPQGTALTIQDLRAVLARRHKADKTCPIYTGYHLKTIAESVLEDLADGRSVNDIVPIWRVLDSKAPTVRKLSAAKANMLLNLRRREGLG